MPTTAELIATFTRSIGSAPAYNPFFEMIKSLHADLQACQARIEHESKLIDATFDEHSAQIAEHRELIVAMGMAAPKKPELSGPHACCDLTPMTSSTKPYGQKFYFCRVCGRHFEDQGGSEPESPGVQPLPWPWEAAATNAELVVDKIKARMEELAANWDDYGNGKIEEEPHTARDYWNCAAELRAAIAAQTPKETP